MDQYGWQQLFLQNLLLTPGIAQVSVNEVDDTTVLITDDGTLLLIGTSVAQGQGALLPILPSAFPDPTDPPAFVSVAAVGQCAFWSGMAGCCRKIILLRKHGDVQKFENV